MTDRRNAAPALAIPETRAFRAYHDFLRHSRLVYQRPLYESAYRSYESAQNDSKADRPETPEDAIELLRGLPEYQLYTWMFRHLQRFKYSRPDFGIIDHVERERPRIEAALDLAAQDAGDLLRLDPDISYPAYYTGVDFHQHPGGVWTDPLAGVIYEEARRTTVASHNNDGNRVYELLFDQLPKAKRYHRVLDWGTGHGAGILTWLKHHPTAEGYGIDLAAPCLRFAHLRAREAGFDVRFSQQDVEHMDFEDGFFDLAFHMYMLHEIPPANTPAVLAEVCRVLKPGGVFAGMELAYVPDEPFAQAFLMTDAAMNNEPYLLPCLNYDYAEAARKAGFRKITATPFEALIKTVGKPSPGMPQRSNWNLYVFEK